MEPVTHILSGALIARAIVPSRSPQDAPGQDGISHGTAMLCGAAAAAFPDLDFVAAAFGQIAYLLNHRGITHSLIVLPLWALLVSVSFALLLGQGKRWLAYYPYALAGLFIHVLGDLITTYGTMILSPLSNTRFEWGTTFIFDFWLSGIVVAGLLCSLLWRTSRLPAVVALAALAGYVGFQAMLKERATEAGQVHARTHGLGNVTVNALPQAFSPFRWMVIIRGTERYWYAHINVLHHETPPVSEPASNWLTRYSGAFQSVDRAVWQQVRQFGADEAEAALSRRIFHEPRFGFYRWFASHPVLYRVERQQGGDCVWFQDMRFHFPGLDRPTFRYGMCQNGSEWLPVRWAGEGVRKMIE